MKCPLCDRDKYTATKQLDLHMEHYHILVEKIHEKIESLETIPCQNAQEAGIYQGVITMLKSLLEENK